IALHTQNCKDKVLAPYVENYIKTVVSMSNEFLKEHMHKHIFLIGMPGAGKTTVGKVLAKELGRDFFDLDQTIQDKVGKSVQNIYIYDGKDAFSEYEYTTIKYPLYEEVAHIKIGNEGSITDAVQEIIEALPNTEK
ncbi:MAG: AAA family ATPase, partial [Veillonella sp.]|nr:AAA family ATPase [Veillonella sp.]